MDSPITGAIITFTKGQYDGLSYHNHDKSSHDQWSTKKRGGIKPKITDSALTAPTPAVEPNLNILDALRNDLCENFCISEEDISKVVDESLN